jgi:hypothetical protein
MPGGVRNCNIRGSAAAMLQLRTVSVLKCNRAAAGAEMSQ